MEIDRIIHQFVDCLPSIKWNSFNSSEIDCTEFVDYYYAEDGLYIIRDQLMEQYAFIKARSPREAFSKFMDRLHCIMNAGSTYFGEEDI